MYVQKAFEDQFGNAAEALIPIVTENVVEDGDTGELSCSFYFLAYRDEPAFRAGKKPVDAFRANAPVTITQSELLNAAGATMGKKLQPAFTDKALSTEEGEPVYRFTGNIGELDMSGAVIVS